MELRHLRYFIAVAEELNFSRAAERLHVSQPPLSRQIQDLEAELKVKLLDRDRQGVQLTKAGHAVLARARKLINDAESLRTEARLMDRADPEELQIGYAPSPTAMVISEVLARYHEMCPGSRITLNDLSGIEIISMVRAKKLHAALTLRPLAGEMRGLKFEPLRRHSPGIICSHASPLAGQRSLRPADLAGSKLVVYRATDFPEYHLWVRKVLGIKKSQLMIGEECSDAMNLIAAVQGGRGVAVVGDFIAPLIGERVRFLPFASALHALEVGVLYRKSGLGDDIAKFVTAALAR